MSYRSLGDSLRPVAEHVRKYLRQQLGITGVKIEEEISPNVSRPTLHGKAPDQTIVCVDFFEDTCFAPSTALFAAACKIKQLPVRAYVAMPEGAGTKDFERALREARSNGVGVLVVSKDGEIEVLADALSLVLADVRGPDLQHFPKKYRDDLALAERTYRQGNPSKGCAGVYEIVEGVTRRLAEHLHKKNLIPKWKVKAPNFQKDSWANLATVIFTELDFGHVLPTLPKPLWAQVIALTRPRNDSNHPPKNTADRVRRDRELRTRFESSHDLLRELLEALKPLKL